MFCNHLTCRLDSIESVYQRSFWLMCLLYRTALPFNKLPLYLTFLFSSSLQSNLYLIVFYDIYMVCLLTPSPSFLLIFLSSYHHFFLTFLITLSSQFLIMSQLQHSTQTKWWTINLMRMTESLQQYKIQLFLFRILYI